MIRAIIIEDNIKALDVLKVQIKDYLPQVSVLGDAGNIPDGVKLIDTIKPELLFLDIDLTDGTSFELLNQLNHSNFEIIFTTGHDKYAVEAFKHNAVHFLLKPVEPKELIEAVNRVATKLNVTTSNSINLNAVLEVLNQSNQKKIGIPTSDGIKYIDIASIIFIKGEGSYSEINRADEKSILVSKLVKELEKQLPTGKFYRANKSYLINLEQVVEYKRVSGGYIVMSDGSEISLSRKKKDDFLVKLSSLL